MKPAVEQDASIDLKLLTGSKSFNEMSKLNKATVEEDAQICCHRYSSSSIMMLKRILCCVID